MHGPRDDNMAGQGRVGGGRTGSREVLGRNLVVGNLEATLDQVNGLLAADGDVASNLLVTTDAESAHGVASCRAEASTVRTGPFIPRFGRTNSDTLASDSAT